jgi:small subunit ribosomal protein S16
MLKIKLSRTSKRNQPQYRVVIAEARSKRDGKVTQTIGYYNPLTQPPDIRIDLTQYNKWLQKGAQPTDTVRDLVKKVS